MAETRELEIFISDWPSLRPHFERGALFLLDRSLDLKHACNAIAKDDRKQIEEWMNQKLIRRPTAEEDKAWSVSPHLEFQFGIVQPFVIFQDIPSIKH